MSQESMSEWRSSQVRFLVLCSASLLIGWHPLVSTFRLALADDEYTHLLLILPLTVALIFLERQSLKPLAAGNVLAGSALLAASFLIAGLAMGLSTSISADGKLSLQMLALVLSWIGAFVLCFGSRAARAVLFPLCFLFGLVPLPQVATNEIVHLLQQGSTWAAHALFAAVGVPVTQSGVLLTIPDLTVEVAKECSSIRSSSMLLVTGMVLAQLFLRSPWRKALVIAIAIPLSVAKNGLRIFTIVMLGTRVDPGYLTGRLHHEGGIIFFTIALAAMFIFVWLLRPAGVKAKPTSALFPMAPRG
jgi:exosortase